MRIRPKKIRITELVNGYKGQGLSKSRKSLSKGRKSLQIAKKELYLQQQTRDGLQTSN